MRRFTNHVRNRVCPGAEASAVYRIAVAHPSLSTSELDDRSDDDRSDPLFRAIFEEPCRLSYDEGRKDPSAKGGPRPLSRNGG
jgi:hypothetical protein